VRFQLITGHPQLVQCYGCLQERTAGSLPHRAASGRILDTVYQDLDTGAYYCEECAAKHAEGIDTARSITKFYADTRGKAILTYDH
jgi:hypothetical protein